MVFHANDVVKAPRLKIENAEKHFSTLTKEVENFLRDTSICLRVKPSDRRSEDTKEMYEWVLEKNEEAPDSLSVILGDCLHNLRTSLDIITCNLARLNGKNPEKVHFPFGKDQANFKKNSKDKLRFLCTKHASYIESLKPYPGGNDILVELHTLDIQDKHDSLLPTVCCVATLPVMIYGRPTQLDPPIPGLTRQNVEVPEPINLYLSTHGDIAYRMPRIREVSVGGIAPSVKLVTINSRFFKNESVLDIFPKLSRTVKDIVNHVETLL